MRLCWCGFGVKANDTLSWAAGVGRVDEETGECLLCFFACKATSVSLVFLRGAEIRSRCCHLLLSFLYFGLSF